jgi:hypothetical protein
MAICGKNYIIYSEWIKRGFASHQTFVSTLRVLWFVLTGVAHMHEDAVFDQIAS